ncbi:MAG: cytochrome c biogenesis protein ResB [Gemmataceae bacterium]|nr:cytochrome c biogenesis protein ResB [Gemmataceae bacterium]
MSRVVATSEGRRLALGTGPHWLFRRLTSVRFALWLIGLIAGGALLGVVVPQAPGFVVRDPALKAAWLAREQERYGPFTGLLDRLGLFAVFHSWWFTGLLIALIASVAVCTCARFRPTWRQITRPQLRVADRYFETAHFRAGARGVDSAVVQEVLRRHRYRVVVVEEGAVRRLYADRYRWTYLGTFVSHLSLVMFLLGGFVTWRLSEQEQVFVAEGTTRPVFAPGSADHLQLKVVDFVRQQDAAGRDVGLYSDIAIFRDGKLVASGRSTINDPLGYGGLRFHQSAFAEDGARLQVRDTESGRMEYDEVVQLAGRLPAPRLVVVGAAGTTLHDEFVAPTFFLPGGAAGAALSVPGHPAIAIALRQAAPGDFRLAVSGAAGGVTEARVGEWLSASGLRVLFAGVQTLDTAIVDGLPGAADGRGVLTEMGVGADQTPFLVLAARDGTTVRMRAGESALIADKTVSFAGQRSFSGITVRRDPGATWIWVATGLLLAGLLLTFYVPRRRLWARSEGDELRLAGVADRWTHFDRELAQLVAEARARSDTSTQRQKREP